MSIEQHKNTELIVDQNFQAKIQGIEKHVIASLYTKNQRLRISDLKFTVRNGVFLKLSGEGPDKFKNKHLLKLFRNQALRPDQRVYSFLKLSGITFITTTSANRKTLDMWKINLNSIFLNSGLLTVTNLFYLIANDGTLLFSNNQNLNSKNILLRPIVQNFVQSGLSSESTTYKDRKIGYIKGMYQTIPNLNVTIFNELGLAQLMQPFKKTIQLILALNLMIFVCLFFFFRKSAKINHGIATSLQTQVDYLENTRVFYPTQTLPLAEYQLIQKALAKNAEKIIGHLERAEDTVK